MIRQLARRVRSLLTGFLAAIGLFAAAPAFACTCIGTFSGLPACQQRWEYSTVFVGRVTRIDPPPARADGLISSADRVQVRLDVIEAFTGLADRVAEVTTARDSASCGYGFKVGETYLIYANRANGALHVSLCSGTTPAANAQDDLRYLRRVPATPLREGRIIGVAMRSDDNPSQDWRPFAGARIVLEGERQRRSATTDRLGRYEIRVPAGSYRIRGETGGGLFVDPFNSGNVTVTETRRCEISDFNVGYDGHVTTRVVTAPGAPVPHLALTLMPVDPAAYAIASARTDTSGRVDIGRVPPGRYTLSFPAAPDVRQTRVITVGRSERVTLAPVVVPADVRLVTLTGVVRDRAGRAVAGALVMAVTDDAAMTSTGTGVATDARGTFAIAVLADRRYVVTVHSARPRDGISRTEVGGVLATAGMSPVTITIARTGDGGSAGATGPKR